MKRLTATKVEEVQVELVQTKEARTTYTLSQLDANIASLEAQQAELQNGLDALYAIREQVETEAGKVELAPMESFDLKSEVLK